MYMTFAYIHIPLGEKDGWLLKKKKRETEDL